MFRKFFSNKSSTSGREAFDEYVESSKKQKSRVTWVGPEEYATLLRCVKECERQVQLWHSPPPPVPVPVSALAPSAVEGKKAQDTLVIERDGLSPLLACALTLPAHRFTLPGQRI